MWRCRRPRVPGSVDRYLLQVEQLVVLVVSDGVVLLIVEPQAGGVLGPPVVAHSLHEVGPLVHHHVVGLAGIVFILERVLVGGEGLDGQVGSQNSSVLGHDVCCFSNTSRSEVFQVWFVSLCHRYVIYIIQLITSQLTSPLPHHSSLPLSIPNRQKNE